MPRAWLVWVSMLMAGPAFAAPSAPAFPYPMKVSRLDNGLTVVRIPFPSRGLVAVDTVVRVGSRNETEPGRTGFAHFFEHMMFRGTPRFPGAARSDRLAALGVLENAFTTDDITLYYCYGPSTALDEVLDLESDRFRNLAYDEAAFRTEARAVLGEYHKNAASPHLKEAEALVGTAFQRHPYRHTTLGFYEDIQKMPEGYGYSREFFQRWYTPDNVMLVISGDFDDTRLMAAVTERYGGWKGKASTTPIPPEPPQTKARTATVPWRTPTLPRAAEAWHTPAARVDTSDAAIAQVLGAYLTGQTSPLYRQAVLEEQWVETVGADTELHRDPSLFVVEAALKDEAHRARFRSALEAEVKALRSGKVDAARVKEIQSALRYQLLMELDTADAIAERVAYYAGIYGEPAAVEKHMRHLATVTPAQLAAFAKQHLTDTQRTTVSVQYVPDKAADKPAEKSQEAR